MKSPKAWSIRMLLIVASTLLISPLGAQPGPDTGSINLDVADENRAIHLHVTSYELRTSKLGDPAPEGKMFLVIRATLSNKNTEKGASIPPVDKAFPMRINGETMIALDPISEDTADPFWGPLVLAAGEHRPVEMVFAVPATGFESAELRHLSNQGRMSIYILGEAPEASTTFLAGPKRAGDSQLAVSSIAAIPSWQGRTAPAGWQYLRVNYLFTNLLELQPLETNIASLSALAEDGGYVYQPLSAANAGEELLIERFYAREATPGEMVFLIPRQHGTLELVHFTAAGAIRLDLTPNRRSIRLPAVIAGPSRSGRITTSVFGIRQGPGGTGLVFDVGLQLNMDDPMADLPIDLSGAFELHDAAGGFIKSDPSRSGLQRPLRDVVIRRDQLVRGEVAFNNAIRVAGQVLVLPLASGHVRLDLPLTSSEQTAQSSAGVGNGSGGGIGTLLGAAAFNPASPGQSGSVSNAAPAETAPLTPIEAREDPAYRNRNSVNDPRIDELLIKAERQIRRKRLTTPRGSAAIDLLDEILLLDPYHPAVTSLYRQIYNTYLEWALLAMQRNQYGKAIRDAQSALDILSRDSRWFGVPHEEVAGLYYLQGNGLAAQGQPSAARSAYLRALNLNPGLDEARAALEELDSRPIDSRSAAEPPPASTPGRSGALDSIRGIPDVLDTGTLNIRGEVIALYGVNGETGLQINNLEAYIRDREVSCERVDPGSFKCFLGDVDLSVAVLLNGAARAAQNAPEALQAAELKAQQNRSGIWE